MTEILFIDKSEHFEFICSNYKMLASEELFLNHSIKFDDAMKSYRSKRVSFKQGSLLNIDAKGNTITVKLPSQEEENVPYDALLIATGASYPSPWRGEDDKLCSMKDRNSEVQSYREDMVKSPTVLIIGAGSTGIETACYLKETYPDKRIAICQRGKEVLPALSGAHQLAVGLLEQVGVELLLETPFNEEMRNEWQFVLDCRGNRFNGPANFMKDELANCLDKKTGQILVN